MNKFKYSIWCEPGVDVKTFILNREISEDTSEAADCQVPDRLLRNPQHNANFFLKWSLPNFFFWGGGGGRV